MANKTNTRQLQLHCELIIVMSVIVAISQKPTYLEVFWCPCSDADDREKTVVAFASMACTTMPRNGSERTNLLRNIGAVVDGAHTGNSESAYVALALARLVEWPLAEFSCFEPTEGEEPIIDY